MRLAISTVSHFIEQPSVYFMIYNIDCPGNSKRDVNLIFAVLAHIKFLPVDMN